MTIDEAHARYLLAHDQGCLATVDGNGAPQNKPVGYRYDASAGTIDIGGFGMRQSAKFQNIARHPEVAFVVNDAVGDGASGMRFLEVRGRAEQAEDAGSISGDVIRIHPRRIVSWNVDPDRPGLRTWTGDPPMATEEF